jgi:DNA invertase Pin-like site-specific DNA recombinase
MNVVAYVRVSTTKQDASGNGREAQEHAISTLCASRQWNIVGWYYDAESSGKERPNLERVLLDVRSPDVDALVVSKLDRIGRSVVETSTLIEQATAEGWLLVSITPAVDMTTPYGRAMAQMACVFAELERSLIRERTSEALQAKIARGEWVGRPPTVGVAVEHRVRELCQTMGDTRIAHALNAEGWQTPSGKPWTRETIRRIRDRLERDDRLGRIRPEVTA